MIPSLVVSEIRSALVEYLSTTFALCDDIEDLRTKGDPLVRVLAVLVPGGG